MRHGQFGLRATGRILWLVLTAMVTGNLVPAQSLDPWAPLGDGLDYSVSGQYPGLIDYPARVVADGSDGFVVVFYEPNLKRFVVNRVGRQGVSTNLTFVNSTPVDSPIEGQLVAVTDGDGGIIFFWAEDRVDNVFAQVYAQRVDRAGAVRWGAHGIPLDDSGSAGLPGATASLVAIPDAHAGAIVAWKDKTDALMLKAIDSAGNIRFEHTFETGLPGTMPDVALTRGGAAGASLVYAGLPSPTSIRIQPLSYMGDRPVSAPYTFTTGVPVKGVTAKRSSDGGLLVGWEDTQARVQKFLSSGTAQWPAPGVDLSSTCSGRVYELEIVSDGAGGVIGSWQDNCLAGGEIKAQRVDATGQKIWGSTPVLVTGSSSSDAKFPSLVADGRGGAIVTWDEEQDLFAQRLGAGNGAPQWSFPSADGLKLGEFLVVDSAPKYTAVSDGAGGVTAFWKRFDGLNETQPRLFGNRARNNDVQALPAKTLSPETFRKTCPSGNAESYTVDLALEGFSLPSVVPASDITLRPSNSEEFSFYTGPSIEAEFAATQFTGYTTRFRVSAIGGSGVGWVPICVGGEPAGQVYISIRTDHRAAPSTTRGGQVAAITFDYGQAPGSLLTRSTPSPS